MASFISSARWPRTLDGTTMVIAALRLISGVTSVLWPISFVAYWIIDPFVEPKGDFFFGMAFSVSGILGLLTIFGFISYALRTDRVPSEKRNLWVAVLCFGHFFVAPFFWFWYVREKRAKP